MSKEKLATDTTIFSADNSKAYLGGISGKCQNGTITNCYNRGNLHDAHWTLGHVRAIGGITGYEEGHSARTAITNCYTTGTISIDTSNMAYGTNWIYMVGNISGGNNSTAANTMGYRNCFYLNNSIEIAGPNRESYQLWADVYKEDPVLWDTQDITAATEKELKSSEALSALNRASTIFYEDTQNNNDGFPVLYWQIDKAGPDGELP